ncbi:hypothetical protein Ddc_17072 [Ditylenchus destructor]|nr:hypothetical protein Ddc_17072 [Ditylenchus destructor]
MGPATAIGPQLSTGWFHGPRHSDWASTFNGVVPWAPPQRLGLYFQRGGSMGPATAKSENGYPRISATKTESGF